MVENIHLDPTAFGGTANKKDTSIGVTKDWGGVLMVGSAELLRSQERGQHEGVHFIEEHPPTLHTIKIVLVTAVLKES